MPCLSNSQSTKLFLLSRLEVAIRVGQVFTELLDLLGSRLKTIALRKIGL